MADELRVADLIARAGERNERAWLPGCAADLQRIASVLAPGEFHDDDELPF
jgi:hypothetical protein